jgi:uncharacterized OB-fold protein
MADLKVDPATGRFLPVIYENEKPYWEAARQRRLILQKCSSCGKVRFPIGPLCPKCQSEEFEWAEMSGRGVVHNRVIYHKPWNDYFKSKVPYAVAHVEIEEGPRLTCNILGIPASEVRIGMPVSVTFEDVTDEITLVQFEPRRKDKAQ